jgi:hypothetical protein
MADMLGRVRMYNLGFKTFTLGSIACGLSQTGVLLVGPGKGIPEGPPWGVASLSDVYEEGPLNRRLNDAT